MDPAVIAFRVVLTTDQVTAIAPDAASLKAGRGLASARKWRSLGADQGALWGLAVGSAQEPYQTRVDLGDLASACSCPSRKFPCKHAIGLMLIAASEPSALLETARPDWLTEWLEARAERRKKSAEGARERAAKPADEKAAQRRREKKEARLEEGAALLRQSLVDLARAGLAAADARNPVHWESLQRRMIDCQAPGLAAALRVIGDDLLRDADVDELLAHEVARLFVLCEAFRRSGGLDDNARAEVAALLGDGPKNEETLALPAVADHWFVAAREFSERERLLTSVTWLWGTGSRRWAKVLRFAHAPATIAEPWPLGAMVEVGLSFDPGLVPARARPHGDGYLRPALPPDPAEPDFAALLGRHAAALAVSPFVRVSPFLLEIRPDEPGFLADSRDRRLPWRADETTALRVECIAGGGTALASGEWDGRRLRLLAIRDGASWISLACGTR